jgi:hypothetical protein
MPLQIREICHPVIDRTSGELHGPAEWAVIVGIIQRGVSLVYPDMSAPNGAASLARRGTDDPR